MWGRLGNCLGTGRLNVSPDSKINLDDSWKCKTVTFNNGLTTFK